MVEPENLRVNAVMFHIGRSGSRVLGDLLAQQSSVHWNGEIYKAFLEGTRRVDPIEHLAVRMRRIETGCFGFEVKFFHLRRLGSDLPNFVAGLHGLGVRRFIVLKRINYLRKIVSSLIAHAGGHWHLRANAHPTLTPIAININRVQIDFDEKPLLRFLEDYHSCFQKLDQLLSGCNTLQLTYEQHVMRDPLIAYRRACEFLGFPPERPQIRYRRTNPFVLQDILLNLDEVRQTLAGTPFEWMTTD